MTAPEDMNAQPAAVPASAGFAVGDVRIGGRPIRYGGQLAEHITVMAGGVAGRRA